MSENQRTLENLLVDEQEISEELLYDLLNGRCLVKSEQVEGLVINATQRPAR